MQSKSSLVIAVVRYYEISEPVRLRDALLVKLMNRLLTAGKSKDF